MATQPDQKAAPLRDGANIVRSRWRDLVLSYDVKSGEDDLSGSLTRDSATAPDQAFAYHLRRLRQQPTLGVDLVNHCNLNCACCYHYAPIAEPGFLSADDYERDLVLLAQIEGVEEFFDAICLMGGEPLLHPHIADFVRLTRSHLPRVTIRLVTNGLLLGDAPTQLWEALRDTDAQVMITPYPTGIDYDGLVRVARERGVHAKLGGGLAVSDEGEAFFLRVPLDETGSQDPTEAFVACALAGSTLQLVDGRIYPCDRGALFHMLNERFGTAFRHEPGDYLELMAVHSAEEVDSFRRIKKPMCRYCAYGLTERVAWRQSSCSPDEWLVRPDEQ